MSQNHIQEQIDLIAKHEQDFRVRRTAAERLGDSIAGFAGSLPFVCIHLSIFAGWMVINTVSFLPLRHFDPAPFPLLGTIVALEAILPASMILMRQSRMTLPLTTSRKPSRTSCRLISFLYWLHMERSANN